MSLVIDGKNINQFVLKSSSKYGFHYRSPFTKE